MRASRLATFLLVSKSVRLVQALMMDLTQLLIPPSPTVAGKDGVYICLPNTGVPDRYIMFQLYNEVGMYGTKELPDENILKLGVQMHNIDDFVREVLAPHLGLPLL